MIYVGQKRIVTNFTQFKFQPMTFEQMTLKANELRRRNEEFLQPQTDAAINSLTHVLHQLAELEVEQAAYENTRVKLKRARTRLEHLKRIAKIISADLLNAECMWIQMRFDFEKAQNRNKFDVMEMHSAESQACLHRIDLMKTALIKPATHERDTILFQINDILLNEFNLKDIPFNNTLFAMYEKLLRNITENLQNILPINADGFNFGIMKEMYVTHKIVLYYFIKIFVV